MMYAGQPPSCKYTKWVLWYNNWRWKLTRYEADSKAAPIGESPRASHIFLFDLTYYAGTKKVFFRRVKRSQAKFWTSRGDEDLVLRHMASRCMMFCVRNAPSMIRYAEPRKKCQHFQDNVSGNNLRRVEDPSNSIVDSLWLWERLMTALVSYDPDSSCEKTCPEPVQCPKRYACNGIQVRIGQRKCCRVDKGVKVYSRFIKASNHK